MNKDKKHLYWVVGLVLITLILCGTLIWINYNSWTIRFEMDDNTKEAIKSLELDNFNDKEINKWEDSFKDLYCYGVPPEPNCSKIILKNRTEIPTGVCYTNLNYIVKCINKSEILEVRKR